MSNFQQQPFQPAPQQAPKPPKKPMSREARIGWSILAGAALLGLGGAAGAAGGSDPSAVASDPQPTVTVTVPDNGPTPDPVTTPTNKPSAPATTAPPKVTEPTAKDFKLTVKTLTKQCFGSAGCNVTYRILVTYSGPTLDPSKEYEVLYEVRGGEDGPVANKLTVADGESSVDEEEMVSTPKSSTKLTAVVTDVLAS
jgi:hypothetical protein